MTQGKKASALTADKGLGAWGDSGLRGPGRRRGWEARVAMLGRNARADNMSAVA